MAVTAKSEIIRFRLTPSQLGALEEAAQIANLPLSTYVHAKIIDVLRGDGYLPDPRKTPARSHHDVAA